MVGQGERRRILLVVPTATYRATDFMRAAKALGVDVVVATDAELVDVGAPVHRIPLVDPAAAADAVAAIDATTPIDAIVALDDQGVLSAAYAAARLGLVHNDPQAVAATIDKLAMRTRFARAEVPQPRFVALAAGASDHDIRALVDALGGDCVVKPTSLAGSQGVIRTSAEGAVDVVARVRTIARQAGAEMAPTLLVEQYVTGVEVAVEALLDNGRLDVLTVFDKPDPLEGPYFEETLYVAPSRLDRHDLEAAVAAVRSAVSALGLRHGPVHAEVRVASGRASVIEVAARSIGGLCSRALVFGTGVSLEQLILAQAIGRRSRSLQRLRGAAGVLMLPIPRAGTLVAVDGVDRARAVDGVTGFELSAVVGRPVVPVPEGNRYLGFLFARGDDPAAVEMALRTAAAMLEIRIDPAREAPGAS
jgi:biotin carboxylase